jgi:hypothetical protein
MDEGIHSTACSPRTPEYAAGSSPRRNHALIEHLPASQILRI